MSDTPRTDAIAHRGYHLDALAARSIDLCRELERENAVLREDKERLDWLDLHISTDETNQLFPWINRANCNILRAAIDTARKEAQP